MDKLSYLHLFCGKDLPNLKLYLREKDRIQLLRNKNVQTLKKFHKVFPFIFPPNHHYELTLTFS